MNRTMRWALVAAFAVLAAPSFSQSTATSGPDAWAISALGKMKKSGLIKQLPAGLFQEGRTASRLEIAVATHSAYSRLKEASQGLGGTRSKLEDAIAKADDPANPVFTRADYEALRSVLTDAKLAAGTIKELAESAANLARMASYYETELAGMGVDVEAMKAELASLAGRISKLEQDELPFDLDVEWNLVSYMGHSRGGEIGLTVDGRPTGLRHSFILGGGGPPTAGLTQDVSVGHEIALGVSGESGKVKWKSTLAIGNLLSGGATYGSSSPGGLLGNQSTIGFDTPFNDAFHESIYFQEFNAWWDFNLGGKDSTVKAGRVGYQGISQLFAREDNTPYFDNPRWDNHLWYFDGGILQFPFQNGSRLDVFGGRQTDRMSSKDNVFGGLWPMTVGEINSAPGEGELDVSQHLGFSYSQALNKRFDYRVNYIFLEGRNSPTAENGREYDRMELFGFDGNYQLPYDLKLNFGKAESTYKHGRGTAVGDDNRFYWANVGWQRGRADGNVGWREIGGNYGAPGDWGRMGVNWRPVDHRGWFKNLNYRAGVNDRFRVEAYEAHGLTGGFDNFHRDDAMRGLVFDWYHRLTGRSTMRLGYEQFHSDDDGDKAQFEWFRIGVTHDIGEDMFFNMLYESSNAFTDSDSYYRPWYGDRRRGGLVTFQFGRKY